MCVCAYTYYNHLPLLPTKRDGIGSGVIGEASNCTTTPTLHPTPREFEDRGGVELQGGGGPTYYLLEPTPTSYLRRSHTCGPEPTHPPSPSSRPLPTSLPLTSYLYDPSVSTSRRSTTPVPTAPDRRQRGPTPLPYNSLPPVNRSSSWFPPPPRVSSLNQSRPPKRE